MRIIQLFLISAAILLAGALTACVAAISGKDFYNLDVPLTQKATDTEYCSAYAVGRRIPPPYGGLAGAAHLGEQYNALFTTCMMDRGYRKYPPRG
ncbi:MAG: hypothetical protein O6829_02585 [Alphaproteobacteria bacterium]|jgi:hypothetical protein|nr:hypothetical protein [Alphaproteobacteria bacterium]MCZ6606716.1 hypothetical protein [Alphaproteobacteria bacterium]